MTVMKMCFLSPSSSLSPRALVIDCGGYELWLQGEGGPVEWLGTPVLWHEDRQEAVSGALPARSRAGGSPGWGSRSSGPAPDFYVLWPASLVKYHLAGSLSSGFWGEGTALKLRKHLVCFGQLDLGEKCQPLCRWLRDFGQYFLRLKGMFLPHPDQRSCLLNISKGDDGFLRAATIPVFWLQNTPALPAKDKVRVQEKRECNGNPNQRPSPQANLSGLSLQLRSPTWCRAGQDSSLSKLLLTRDFVQLRDLVLILG